MELPVAAVAGPVLVIARSEERRGGEEGGLAEAALLAGVGSGSLPLTVAGLVMRHAVAAAVALAVTDALAPVASEPTAQVTVPVAFGRPEMAETKDSSAGGVSVAVEPVLASGPLLATCRV